MLKPRNEYEFVVLATKRSGHHALIAWISYHFSRPVYFFNDCKRFLSPYATWAKRLGTLDRWNAVVQGCGNCQCVNYDTYEQLAEVRHRNKECIIYNYESPILTSPLPDLSLELGESIKRRVIIVLRDYENTAASCFRLMKPHGWRKLKRAMKSLNQSYVTLAREVLGETNHIPSPVFVRYDRWFLSASYRSELAVNLGLHFTDQGLATVPSAGGGSSFDGLTYQGRGQEMDVMSRYLRLKDDDEFCRHLSREAAMYSHCIFSHAGDQLR